MSLRTWSQRTCAIALITLIVGCGDNGSTTTGGVGGSGTTGTSGGAAGGNSGGNTGGSSSSPVVTGVSTPKSVSVVTAN